MGKDVPTFKDLAQVSADQGLGIALCLFLVVVLVGLLWWQLIAASRERRAMYVDALQERESLEARHVKERGEWRDSFDNSGKADNEQLVKIGNTLTLIAERLANMGGLQFGMIKADVNLKTEGTHDGEANDNKNLP